jgi:hypothetical protein
MNTWKCRQFFFGQLGFIRKLLGTHVENEIKQFNSFDDVSVKPASIKTMWIVADTNIEPQHQQ